MNTHGWCVKHPQLGLLANTFATNRDACRMHAFDFEAAQDEDFRRAFWKRWDPGQEELARRGYKIVRVELVEA